MNKDEKTQYDRESENAAYKEGLHDKDYTWGDGIFDALTKWGTGRIENEEGAFQKGQQDKILKDLE